MLTIGRFHLAFNLYEFDLLGGKFQKISKQLNQELKISRRKIVLDLVFSFFSYFYYIE